MTPAALSDRLPRGNPAQQQTTAQRRCLACWGNEGGFGCPCKLEDRRLADGLHVMSPLCRLRLAGWPAPNSCAPKRFVLRSQFSPPSCLHPPGPSLCLHLQQPCANLLWHSQLPPLCQRLLGGGIRRRGGIGGWGVRYCSPRSLHSGGTYCSRGIREDCHAAPADHCARRGDRVLQPRHNDPESCAQGGLWGVWDEVSGESAALPGTTWGVVSQQPLFCSTKLCSSAVGAACESGERQMAWGPLWAAAAGSERLQWLV